MIENGRISTFQFGVLVFLYTIGSTILVVTSGLAEDAKQDAWIAAILGVGFNLLMVIIYSKLGSLFPNMNFVEYSEKILGKWLGTAISLLYIFFCFIGAATVLFDVGNFLATAIMPETPIESIIMIFAIIIIMGLRLGVEVIARTSEILLPWFIALFLLLVIPVSTEVKLNNIQPILAEASIKHLVLGGLRFSSVSSLPFIVFLMVIPYINTSTGIRKQFLLGAFVGGLCLTIVTFLTITVLGVDFVQRNYFPSYTLAKSINIANFLQRIEAIVAGMWFISTYYKIVMYSYASILGFLKF